MESQFFNKRKIPPVPPAAAQGEFCAENIHSEQTQIVLIFSISTQCTPKRGW